MFKIIRVAEDYSVVILISPADATVDTPGAKFYLFTRQLGKPGVFNGISRGTASGYSSRQADGLGFGELREEPFTSLEEALQYVEEKRDEFAVEFSKELKRMLEDRSLREQESTPPVSAECERFRNEVSMALSAGESIKSRADLKEHTLECTSCFSWLLHKRVELDEARK